MAYVSEKLKYVLQDLQAQEKLCVEKYTKGAEQAKDPELKNLFNSIKDEEQKHYNSIGQLLNGTVPAVNSQNDAGKNYNPSATYVGSYNQADKDNDQLLCTDSIATEKYVSSAYNFNIFQFGEPDVRKLLNNIETEEQNHAEKIYKYKTANQMM